MPPKQDDGGGSPPSAATANHATFHRSRSHWFETADSYMPERPLKGDIQVDVCVVGGGINGLSSAYHLRKIDPTIEVALLEAEVAGFGASGRNAGQLIVAFGHGDFGQQIRHYGAENMGTAWRYVHEGIRMIEALLTEESIDCDYAPTGYLQTSLRVEGEKKLRAYMAFIKKIGQVDYMTYVSGADMASEFDSPYLGAALLDPRGGMFNPLKLMRGIKRAAIQRGARIFENSPVARIERTPRSIILKTGGGSVRCEKLILATNAYTHTLDGLDGIDNVRMQSPLLVHGNVTEPLTPSQWEGVRWPRRCGVNLMSDIFYSFAPTRDGRILYVGGYYANSPPHKALSPEISWRFQAEGHHHLGQFFPALKDVRTVQSWGGPISTTADFIPHVGFASDPRIVYACGCWGHGIPIGTHNGRTLAELTLGLKTQSTETWFVRRKTRLWPGRSLASFVSNKVVSMRQSSSTKIGRKMKPPLNFGYSD
ncbi:MAG TPA: FAD-binding oxidoreductase [Rhizomicrobium sp.]|jgi:glycine/D-amino acid oxidase-like deaminating enzyme